jgi:predicted amidohydrolase YtcJ
MTPRSRAEEVKGYKKFFEDLVKLGITSVNVAGASPAMLRLYQALQNEFRGTLPRMTVQVSGNPGNTLETTQDNLMRLEGYGWRTGAGDEWIKLGAVKMNLDGGYTFSRPWPINREPHKHVPTYFGGWRQTPDHFYHMMKRAHELGWQLGVHVAGDGAAVVVVDLLERILTENPRADHRHHLIHVEVAPPEETFQKMKRLGIGVALQPNFTYTLQPFFSWALSGERLETNNPSRSILKHGLHLSYGADERPYGPLIGIFAQVTRRGVDGKVYGPQEAVTVQEAIRAYTVDSAWHTFDERKRGSLEVGKLADMVVLAEDILAVDPLRIKDIRVLQTIIGGTVVFSALGATTDH